MAFGYAGSSASIRSYGTPKGASSSGPASGGKLPFLSISYVLVIAQIFPYITLDAVFAGGVYGSGQKEYKEPWVSKTMALFYTVHIP